jgi:hypothetical protein
MTHEPGPLAKLMAGLGIDADLAPIAAVKRIEEMPVRLNPETLLGNKPRNIPEHYTPDEINAIVEAFESTTKRHGYVFERCPVGHDMGYRCFRLSQYDGPESPVGYGLTENEAYVDYLARCDEEPGDNRLDREVDDQLHSEAFPND